MQDKNIDRLGALESMINERIQTSVKTHNRIGNNQMEWKNKSKASNIMNIYSISLPMRAQFLNNQHHSAHNYRRFRDNSRSYRSTIEKHE